MSLDIFTIHAGNPYYTLTQVFQMWWSNAPFVQDHVMSNVWSQALNHITGISSPITGTVPQNQVFATNLLIGNICASCVSCIIQSWLVTGTSKFQVLDVPSQDTRRYLQDTGVDTASVATYICMIPCETTQNGLWHGVFAVSNVSTRDALGRSLACLLILGYATAASM